MVCEKNPTSYFSFILATKTVSIIQKPILSNAISTYKYEISIAKTAREAE